MKIQLSRLKNGLSVLALSAVVVASSAATVSASPISAQAAQPPKAVASGQQAKPPVEPGKVDAKASEKLGPTNVVKNPSLSLPKDSTLRPLVGNVSGVDFQTFNNYCYRNLVYTTVRNTTTSVKYIHVQMYISSTNSYQDVYTSVAAGGSYTYPAFYGVNGAYSAYLYVWNGSSYVYDEYKGGTNNCSVAVTRTYNTGGWVQLKIQNTGTAYVSQVSSQLAPYPNVGTYTGTHYDYPAAGGAAIYRWFQVGSSPYGITSYTLGSYNNPSMFTGDL